MNVPLDHGLLPGPRGPGRLPLQVAAADNTDAPRGVLVWLVGGPGEPGVGLTADIAGGLDPAVLAQYRLVLFDQRGTGPGALQCRQLQQVMGDSDLIVPPPAAVSDCATSIGDNRRFYATADTIADLDALRQALGAERLSLDGVSYGSFVAARYAVIHPNRVSRLVLDSVVPHESLDPLEIAAFAHTTTVLGMVCQEIRCGTDPARDLSQVVHARHNGPEMLEVLTALTDGRPRLAPLLPALHAATRGDYAGLDAITAAVRHDAATPANKLSQGLHASTLCEDLRWPWSDAATSIPERASATATAIAALPEQAFFPYDRDTAIGNGQTLTCQQWPPTPIVAFPVGANLPAVPTLLLAGDHDLDTPLAWTQQEAAHAPAGHLVIIAGSGHITQNTANGPAGRAAATGFLTSP